jgi:hypothetical protein
LQNEFYREFYDKALIPAGTLDRKSFSGDQQDLEEHLVSTHMLVGLQGTPNGNSSHLQWHVTIFKADSQGHYDASDPIYSSDLYDKFDAAVEASRIIENEVRHDQLHIICFQEKIS